MTMVHLVFLLLQMYTNFLFSAEIRDSNMIYA